MNPNKKTIIAFIIIEGEKAYTETNFYEGFLNCIKWNYKKIHFIHPFSLNGDIKNDKNVFKLFWNRLSFNIKITTDEEFNFLDKIHIFLIWDNNPNKKTNFKNNFEFIKQKINEKNIKCDSIIFEKSIEKGLFCKFFEKNPSIKELCKKMEYKDPKTFKKRSNKHLFYNIINKSKIKMDDNLIKNMKNKLSKNDKNNDFIKLLDLIEKLNNNKK